MNKPRASAAKTAVVSFAILYAMGSGASFVGQAGWLFDLLSHFRVQALLIGLLVCAVTLSLRTPKAAAIAGLATTAHLVSIAALFTSGSTPPEPDSVEQALVFNVNSRGDPAAVSRLLKAHTGVGVVGLIEVTPAWSSPLDAALIPWPHRVTRLRRDNFGMLLASRYPLEEIPCGETSTTAICAIISPPDRPSFGFALVHPPPPMGREWTASRDADIRVLAGVDRLPADRIVAGDFNASPWSVALNPLSAAGLRLASQGRGPMPSWPSSLGALGIPIDHAFVGGSITAHRFEVLADAGSDHRPILLSFSQRAH